MLLGSLIKQKRESLSMTQAQLSDGICSQAFISKLERNEISPSAEIMVKLSDRLETPLFFFYTDNMPVENLLEEIKHSVRIYLSRREYVEIKLLLQQHQQLIKNLSDENDIMFFNWVKGILYYYVENEPDKSLHILNDLKLPSMNNELNLEVLTSIAVINLEQKDYISALKAFEIIYSKIGTKIDLHLKLKILFNYSLCLSQNNNLENSLDILIEGIEICRVNNTMYLLGDFLYQKSLILSRFEEWRKSITSAKQAELIFNLQGNEKFEIKTKLLLKKLILRSEQ